MFPLALSAPPHQTHTHTHNCSIPLCSSKFTTCLLASWMMLQRCHDLNSISSRPTTDAFLYLNLCLFFSFPDVPTPADESQCSHVCQFKYATRLRSVWHRLGLLLSLCLSLPLPPYTFHSSFILGLLKAEVIMSFY